MYIPGWFGGSPKNCDSICPDLPGGTEEPEGNPPISASGLREPVARSVRAAAELRTEHLKRQTRSLESGHLLLQGLKPSTAPLASSQLAPGPERKRNNYILTHHPVGQSSTFPGILSQKCWSQKVIQYSLSLHIPDMVRHSPFGTWPHVWNPWDTSMPCHLTYRVLRRSCCALGYLPIRSRVYDS